MRYSLLPLSCLFLVSLLISCERPELGSSPGDAGDSEKEEPAEPVVKTEEVEEAAPKNVREGITEGEFREPELRVYRKAEEIVLVGALKSRLQIERIESEMGAAFSGTRIDNRLVLDFKRHPVGWGNRVSRDFLVPFFAAIEEPYVEYSVGVITLGGYGTKRQYREFQTLAGTVFTGSASSGIDNQIVEKVVLDEEEK